LRHCPGGQRSVGAPHAAQYQRPSGPARAGHSPAGHWGRQARPFVEAGSAARALQTMPETTIAAESAIGVTARMRLRLRSVARLLANQLLGRAVQIAGRVAGRVHDAGRRAGDHTGVLTIHHLRIAAHQACGRRLRRDQGSWSNRNGRDLLRQPDALRTKRP
jgi:hypothetical protein